MEVILPERMTFEGKVRNFVVPISLDEIRAGGLAEDWTGVQFVIIEESNLPLSPGISDASGGTIIRFDNPHGRLWRICHLFYDVLEGHDLERKSWDGQIEWRPAPKVSLWMTSGSLPDVEGDEWIEIGDRFSFENDGAESDFQQPILRFGWFAGSNHDEVATLSERIAFRPGEYGLHFLSEVWVRWGDWNLLLKECQIARFNEKRVSGSRRERC